MASDPGSVSIADDGTVTASGLANVFFQQLLAKADVVSIDVPPTSWEWGLDSWRERARPMVVAVMRELAKTATALASVQLEGFYSEVHTTSNEATNVAVFTIPENCMVMGMLRIMSKRTGVDPNTARTVRCSLVTANRYGSGAAQNVLASELQESVIGGGITGISASGNNIIAQLEGELGVPRDWRVQFDLHAAWKFP